MRKSGEKSNSKNIAQRFVLGITEMHPKNRHWAAESVCVGIDKIFGENKLTWKCCPTPSTPWDQTLGHLRMVSIALCSGYVHQVKRDVRSTMAWKVQVISPNAWQDLLTACPHFLVQRKSWSSISSVYIPTTEKPEAAIGISETSLSSQLLPLVWSLHCSASSIGSSLSGAVQRTALHLL